MESVKNYVLSLVGFSFISSVACSFLPEIPAKRTVKFICGIILSLLILSPLMSFELDFTDIFPETQSYNLYSNDKANELKQKVITDKVYEIVETTFAAYQMGDVETEVVFDESGNILKITVNKVHEKAARDIASALGVPYEIIHMTG